MHSELFYLQFEWNESIHHFSGVWFIFDHVKSSCCNFYPNIVEPGQKQPSSASDLGLHCLPMSFYRLPGMNDLQARICLIGGDF